MKRIVRRERAIGTLCCAFTGHRPSKYPYLGQPESEPYALLRSRLEEAVIHLTEEGAAHFISGGALGVDMLAAELIVELRQDNPLLTLEMALPCPEQAARWRREDRLRHELLCEEADVLTVISEFYTPFCMYERNRFLAESCDILLAVYDGTPGGTRMTVGLAYDAGKRIEIIRP